MSKRDVIREMSKRDDIASLDNPTERIGSFHVSTLLPFQEFEIIPVAHLRRRRRSREHPVSSPRRKSETEGKDVMNTIHSKNNKLYRVI